MLIFGAAVNAAIFAWAVAVYLDSRSQLVLAQGSDSLLDIVGGSVLVFTALYASQPRDRRHPFGHQRAEPIGALVTAILAGALAFEVAQSSITALVAGEHVALAPPIAVFLGGKLAIKLVLLLSALRSTSTHSAATRALRVDTRNDVIACASSLVGFGLSHLGYLWADAALAVPVAFYIAYSGLELGRENVRYLIGESPSEEVLVGLERAAGGVDGVIGVDRLRAQHVGSRVQVDLTIVVPSEISATEAHDIAADVKERLEADPLVLDAFVHVDTRAGRVHG